MPNKLSDAGAPVEQPSKPAPSRHVLRWQQVQDSWSQKRAARRARDKMHDDVRALAPELKQLVSSYEREHGYTVTGVIIEAVKQTQQAGRALVVSLRRKRNMRAPGEQPNDHASANQ